MAEKPTLPDNNILVYVQDYDNNALQATLNPKKAVCRGYEGPRCETAAATSSGLPPSDAETEPQSFSAQSIVPPYGWKRIVGSNGIVIYISPSNTALSSTEQVKEYLLSDGTCKCGLECPINCETTFNFNPKVLTKPWSPPLIGPSDLTKLCNHKRKLLGPQMCLDSSLDIHKYDALRKKKRKFPPSLPHGISCSEKVNNEPEKAFNGSSWRENSEDYNEESYTNGYQSRYESSISPQFRIEEGTRFSSQNNPTSQHLNQVNFENRSSYGPNTYEKKIKRPEYIQPQETQGCSNLHSVPIGLNVNRTPPWQQRVNQANNCERVPPLHTVPSSSIWNNVLKKKQVKFVRKKYPEDGSNSSSGSTPEPPSFLEDPSGYLAQQTALLNSTISRQNNPVVGDTVPCHQNKYTPRPRCRTMPTTRFPDSSIERRKFEEPSSTLPDKSIDDRGPIQGSTVSTSHRSPVDIKPPENIVTTMASGHTQSSNTITSVLAGKANTATVSVNNQGMPQKAQPSDENNSVQQEDIEQILVPSPGGQLVVSNSMLPAQPKSVLNQPTVLLPGPLLLQPTSVVVDALNTTVQIPQIVSNVVQNQVLEDTSLLSPDSKRKANMKKRKLSPTVGPVLLSPQGSNNVMVQQQQINTPMLQALTILPGKTGFSGTQQLITTNMLQPLNLVQNFPIQQFIVPTGVGGMVMSDGSILQDTVQLNLLAPVQNTGVFSNSQNLLTPGMVIRTPSSQSSHKVLPNNQFLNSPNQYVVNNAFGGPVSPLLSVSPNQCNRNQEYLSQNVIVQQPSSSNAVVQQNTTIVQQTTMVSSQQTQPTHTLNLNQNFILNDKSNFILTSEKQNFVLNPNNDKIIISPDSMRGNFVLGSIDKQNFMINNVEKQNVIINSFEKNYSTEKRSTVSTQTQVTSPGPYRESPPDTTTLSPVDQEVTTSLQPATPPDSLPMVHCISSSSHLDDQPFSVDSYTGNLDKSSPFSDPSPSGQPAHHKSDDYRGKTSLSEVPDDADMSINETVSSS